MSRIEELLLAWEGQTLNDDGREELKKLLSNPENRAELVKYLHTSEMIVTFFSEQDASPQELSAHRPPTATTPDRAHASGQRAQPRTGRVVTLPLRPLALAASVLLVVGLSLVIHHMLQKPMVARIDEVQGEVLARSVDGSRLVEQGMDVTSGDELVSRGAKSGALLTYSDGSWVRIDGDAHIAVSLESGGQRVHLLRGRLLAKLNKQKPGLPFVFSTPQATAAVLGTRLALEVKGDATSLRVDKGRVRLTRLSDGKSIEVPGGHMAVAARGRRLASRPSVIASAAVKTVPIRSALVAHLSFDAPRPESVSMRPGDDSERSVRLLEATDAGLRGHLAKGKKGAAFAADAIAATLGHHQSLTPQRLSLSVWFKVTVPESDIARPVLVDKEVTERESGFVLRGFEKEGKERSNRMVFVMWTDQGQRRVSCSVDEADQWNHVAITFDGSTLKMFCNGEKADAVHTGVVRLAHNEKGITMGRFIGLMDEVRFYDRALSEQEVRKLAAE